jgi:hypothetical protein
MTLAITRLYDDSDLATLAVDALKREGYTDEQISFVEHADVVPKLINVEGPAGTAEFGASVGSAIGAGAGLLTSLGVMVIPGVGPAVAAGWLLSTAAGAAVGALAGATTGGVIGAFWTSGERIEAAEIVEPGDSLVTVRVPEDRMSDVLRILDGPNPHPRRGTGRRRERRAD